MINTKSKLLLSWWFVVYLSLASVGCYRHPTTGSPALALIPIKSTNLQTIRTLCLVELHNNTAYPQISAEVTESLYQALQKKQISGMSMLRQNDVTWRNLQIRTDTVFTLEQLLETRKMLVVDAAIIGTITSFSPYPHMSMGIQLKLIDLRDGRVICAIEQIWDTADKATEKRIKKYFEQELRQGFAPLNEQLAALSTINFVRFVTYDVAETLKPERNWY
jgi:hypothetical protein